MYLTNKKLFLSAVFCVLISQSWGQTYINTKQTQIFNAATNPTVAELFYDTDDTGASWFANESTSTALNSTDLLIDGEDYYVESDNNVLGERLRVNVVLSTPVIELASTTPPQSSTICEGEQLSFTVNGLLTNDEFRRLYDKDENPSDPNAVLDYFFTQGDSDYYMYKSDDGTYTPSGSGWTEAFNEINSRFPGASMVLFETRQECIDVHNALPTEYKNVTQSIWMGLRQYNVTSVSEEPSNNWHWVDGTPLNPSESNWNLHPTNSDFDEPNDWNQNLYNLNFNPWEAINNSLNDPITGLLAINDENFGQFESGGTTGPTGNLWNDKPDDSGADGQSFTLIEMTNSIATGGTVTLNWGLTDINGDLPPITGEDQEAFLTPVLTSDIVGVYVEVTMNGGTPFKVRYNVDVQTIPTPEPIVGSNLGCLGRTITYTTNMDTSSGQTVTWSIVNEVVDPSSPNPTNVLAITSGNGTNSIDVDVVGIGSAEITYSYDNNVCQVNAAINKQVSVIDLQATDGITADTTNDCPGAQIQLSTVATDVKWYSRDVSIATINEDTGLATLVSPGDADIYYEKEYVDSDGTDTGCIAVSDDFTITVNSCPSEEIEINAFSPNGDGINDTFDITNFATRYPEYTIKVFNRWGAKVFEGNANKDFWNGTVDNTGSDVPAGGYYYIVDKNDGSEPENGKIYLNR